MPSKACSPLFALPAASQDVFQGMSPMGKSRHFYFYSSLPFLLTFKGQTGFKAVPRLCRELMNFLTQSFYFCMETGLHSMKLCVRRYGELRYRLPIHFLVGVDVNVKQCLNNLILDDVRKVENMMHTIGTLDIQI